MMFRGPCVAAIGLLSVSVGLGATTTYDGCGATKTGGYGWNGDWKSSNGATWLGTSLGGTQVGFSATDGRVSLKSPSSSSAAETRRQLDVANVYSDMKNPHSDLSYLIGGVAGKSIWISWLRQASANVDSGTKSYSLQLYDNTGGQEMLSVGRRGSSGFGLCYANSDYEFTAAPAGAVGTASRRYVLAIDFFGTTDGVVTDRVRVWADTPADGLWLTSPLLDTTVIGGINFDAIRLSYKPGETSSTMGFDEIRIGTQASDVAVVPEPSTVLLGLGVSLVALFRRQRTAVSA